MSNNSNGKKNQIEDQIYDFIEKLLVALFLLFVASLKIAWKGAKRITDNDLLIWSVGAFIAMVLVGFDLHYYFYKWVAHDSYVENLELIRWLHGLGGIKNWLILMLPGIWLHLLVKGIVPYFRHKRFQNRLNNLGIKNGIGEKATILDIKELDQYRSRITIKADAIPITTFYAQKEALESAFRTPIESIYANEAKPNIVYITLSTKVLGKVLKLSDVLAEVEPGHFVIGDSKSGLMQQKLFELPHLLIAGATGSGKSVFFKQVITALIERTKYLQVYLIDLKGGIEMNSFDKAKNVAVVSELRAAVKLLKRIDEEMKSRFDYLSKKGLQKIDPSRDGFDPIVVGIDEASVLFTKVSRSHADYELIMQARSLVENISKLSRAASISLILATQKVTKETIDTRIQENIAGKICFKMNTPEGSVRVIGTGDARNLPDTPGRGIWQLGSKSCEVQVPYISNTEVDKRMLKVEEEYLFEERKLRSEMIDVGQVNHEQPSFLTESA